MPDWPVMEGARWVLHATDCRSVLPTLSHPTANLLLTDPPYGVSWQSSFRTVAREKMHGDDGSLDVPAILGAYARRVLWSGQHVYVFGYRPELLTGPMRLGSACELIWDKGGMSTGDLSLPWAAQHEMITFGVYLDCVPRVKRGGLTARLRSGSVLRVPRVHGSVARHQSEKPVLLLRQLIESSSQIGDTVIDPFAGSGSVGVAALLEGRRFIGVESDAGHAATAAARLARAEAAWLATQAM